MKPITDVSRQVEKVLETEHGVPPLKAKHMSRSIWRGAGLILLGLVQLTLGAGIVGYVIFKLGKEPGLAVMVFGGGLALSGVYFLVAGGNQMSGQALDAAGGSPLFGLMARAIRFAKPRDPPAPPPPVSTTG